MLIVKNTSTFDGHDLGGSYACEAKNKYGVLKGYAYLNVQGGYNGDHRSE